MVWPITGAESYVGKMGESMKAAGLADNLLPALACWIMQRRWCEPLRTLTDWK